jgi:hypothetical protein
MEKETIKAGAPSKYEKVNLIQLEKICRLGATDEQLADFYDVHRDTISEWKTKHPEFSDTLKRGKMLADAEIVNSLYHRALGYSHEDIDIKMFEGKIIKTPIIKHYPPDTTAAIFWLKNRQSGGNVSSNQQIVIMPYNPTGEHVPICRSENDIDLKKDARYID